MQLNLKSSNYSKLQDGLGLLFSLDKMGLNASLIKLLWRRFESCKACIIQKEKPLFWIVENKKYWLAFKI